MISYKFLYMLFISLLLSLSIMASSSNELPEMGSSINKILPLNIEQELGDKYMRLLRQQLPVVKDPQIRNYINELGFRLVSSSEDARDRNFYFFVINDPSINAFAMPGGYIGVNSGLILKSNSESELAGVIAHEIAHVTQRHIARRLEQQQQMSMPTMLAALGSILVMTQNAEAGMAALTGFQAGATQVIINHTRTNESEADRVGIITLANAGFNPVGMAAFFETLLQMSRYKGTRLAFLSTHPLSQTRVTESRDRARNLKYRPKGSQFNYQLFKQRLSTFLPKDLNSEKKLIEGKIVNLKNTAIPAALDFSYALTLTQLSEYKKSSVILNKLITSYPDNHYFSLAMAELNIAKGNPKQAA
jgi:predicted Zn-dependent protease